MNINKVNINLNILISLYSYFLDLNFINKIKTYFITANHKYYYHTNFNIFRYFKEFIRLKNLNT